jgi:hypothetical protein
MSAIDRAAEIIFRGHIYSDTGQRTAQDLADAGLLVTDEMRAVVKAAVDFYQRAHWMDSEGVTDDVESLAAFEAAVDAYVGEVGR